MKLYYITREYNGELVALAGPLYSFEKALNAKQIIKQDYPEVDISTQIIEMAGEA